jgi:hypothetical protein
MPGQALFLPTFGNRPAHLVGRDDAVAGFIEGLTGPPGHPNRATLYRGQRGMGKTALLLELEAQAATRGFVVARVAANQSLLDEIIQLIQAHGAKHVPQAKKVKGFNAGALGFSVGLTFADQVKDNYGFRLKLTMLADELAKHDIGIVLLVDEVQANMPEMRELATTYQHLVGEGKNVAIGLAGLPEAVSALLNDDVLTFLNRTKQIELGPVALNDVVAYYTLAFAQTGKTITPETVEQAAQATYGYPYLLQLIGYHLLALTGQASVITDQTLTLAVNAAKRDLVSTVFRPALKPLSAKDVQFLKAMAPDAPSSAVATLEQRLGWSRDLVQLYRARLIAAGLVTPAGRGRLRYTLAYLGEYLDGRL